jgi:hypothetical protein
MSYKDKNAGNSSAMNAKISEPSYREKLRWALLHQEFALFLGLLSLIAGLVLLSPEEWHDLRAAGSGALIGAGLRMLFDYFQRVGSRPINDVSGRAT